MTYTQKHAPVWVIGDVQGCFDSLKALLEHPELTQDPSAKFCFAGDLINRGPESLACLRHIKSLGDKAISLLGNHDIHLLGLAAGVRKLGKSDTAQEILNAPDRDELIEWLRHRPLSTVLHEHLIVHAGVAPEWTTQRCLELSAEVESILQGANWKHQVGELFGNLPDRWSDDLKGADRHRAVINALTRMRACYSDGRMNFAHKGAPDGLEGHTAWYDMPQRQPTLPVVFGHWSTLGLFVSEDAVCLDTGCVWGGQLSAMRLPDRRIVQVNSQEPAPLTPGAKKTMG